ncbi:MAG: prephenate dehydrogenase/arogenate dehydrogenase family protein [Longimicrobiales bacterium]
MSSAPTPAEPGPRRVAVLGLGVMGGSLVRALARRTGGPAVAGWSPDPAERQAARAEGALDEAPGSWQDAVHGADLVVLAAPLADTCDLLGRLPPHLDAGAVVTDVASLKAPVVRAARSAGLEDRFAGSHPMTGSESRGFDASRAELYDGAPVWVVPGGEAATAAVAAFWRALGAAPTSIDAEAHDRLMALVSHLPQLAATALADTLADRGVSAGALGPGGRDTTRLAASNPEMWRDILAHAPPESAAGLRALAGALDGLADALEAGDVDHLTMVMARTAAWKARP